MSFSSTTRIGGVAMAAEAVLLETSAQCCRILDPENRRDIKMSLWEAGEVYSTSLAFREFLRSWIKNLDTIHGIADDYFPSRFDKVVIADLLEEIFYQPRTFSNRSIRRYYLILSRLLRGFPRAELSKARFLTRLRQYRRAWIRDFFQFSTEDGKTRQVFCLRGLDDRPDELEDLKRHRLRDPDPPFPRSAVPFLERHADEVEKIESQMTRATLKAGRDKKLLETLDRLKGEDGRFEFRSRLHVRFRGRWNLVDVLIAIESPRTAEILSIDKHFLVLGQALGKRVRRIPWRFVAESGV